MACIFTTHFFGRLNVPKTDSGYGFCTFFVRCSAHLGQAIFKGMGWELQKCLATFLGVKFGHSRIGQKLAFFQL